MAGFEVTPEDAASLEPTTLKAWDEYVQSASLRMEQRLISGKDEFATLNWPTSML
jgi:hypothetical protein